ncbi:MAG: hypothetical protein NE334_19280 [Lentisphaeraceae bacterium]|nr:hypothetical protein [Lentisphaeraceae bacterium]
MLEPITPSTPPDKPTKTTEEKPIAQSENVSDSEGYRFNFFGGPKKKKQKKNAASTKNVYNEENAVKLSLSPEAEKELEKQRRLKDLKDKSQDNE